MLILSFEIIGINFKRLNVGKVIERILKFLFTYIIDYTASQKCIDCGHLLLKAYLFRPVFLACSCDVNPK